MIAHMQYTSGRSKVLGGYLQNCSQRRMLKLHILCQMQVVDVLETLFKTVNGT